MAALSSGARIGRQLLHRCHSDRLTIVAALIREWSVGADNSWIGTVAVPLGMTATGLLAQWWTWPLLLVESAIATRREGWAWVLSLELAFVGTTWAFAGASALGTWPSDAGLIGVVWAAFPGVLAVVVSRDRHQPLLGAFRLPRSVA